MTDAVVRDTGVLADEEAAENPMAHIGTPHSNAVYAGRSLGFWFYLMSDAVVFAVLRRFGPRGAPAPRSVPSEVARGAPAETVS